MHLVLRSFSTHIPSQPLHLGTLYYLNVHTSPPYFWQRCQAILYPHTLLLTWIAPGSGRGVVQLDLVNCGSVESALSLGHPRAQDDVGTVAARTQDRAHGTELVETLVPFWMVYGDGVERLASESLVERQRWYNRIWYVEIGVFTLLADITVGTPSIDRQARADAHGHPLAPFVPFCRLTAIHPPPVQVQDLVRQYLFLLSVMYPTWRILDPVVPLRSLPGITQRLTRACMA